MNEELEKVKKERDKVCKDYLELYAKVENVKELVKHLIKKEKHKIETNEYIVMFLEELGDLKEILDALESRN